MNIFVGVFCSRLLNIGEIWCCMGVVELYASCMATVCMVDIDGTSRRRLEMRRIASLIIVFVI